MKHNGYSYSYRLVISNSQIVPITSMWYNNYMYSVDLFVNVVAVEFLTA